MIESNIIIAKDSGFCFGVKNAFEKTISLTNTAKNICIYGEMVHNKYALNNLYNKGVIEKEDINEIINDDRIDIVVIRAHGVSPKEEQILRESNKQIVDLTCPKVKNIQLLAKKLADDNYFILIYGKENHPEVIGIKGYCEDKNLVIKEKSDIDKIANNIKKIALISQTTMNSDKFHSISVFIKQKMPNIDIYDTLCKAPINKQNEAIALSKSVDCMIVVGDRLSSNTVTLFEKLKEVIPSFFIEKIEDIDIEKIKNYDKIGISGGSSTSYEQLEQIKNYLLTI
ncbi:MAG TPA: 4-hydroxy-3-methylbut-2-enyl diphosphate reductase [Spirochaetota bacterium]|nr:4-hydroxy-3-methylbut-2-enyl diphosphate reductase [Spirochaetota bacterium]